MKKKFLSILMASMLTLAMPLTAFAEGTTSYGNGDESGSITVTANVTASYSIRLPATIALTLQSDGSYKADYEVGVKANIPTDKVVAVTPEPTFELENKNHIGDIAHATVTQNKQVWMGQGTGGNYPENIMSNPGEYVNTTGTIVSNDLCEKGLGTNFEGQLTFTFAYRDF